MENNITFKDLSSIGFSKYVLTTDGKLYKKAAPTEIKKDILNRLYLINDNGAEQRITLKKIYRMAYNVEYCIDNIQNLPNEEWKPIENTKGKYYISNCGRVKSLCGYTAKVLQLYQKENGYLIVKINNKNVLVHRLVAFAFCENKYKDYKTEIHHKDGNRNNNRADNLEILSIAEHHKRHLKKESIDNGNVLY